MKIVINIFLVLILSIVLFIFISGKTWLLNAVNTTYFRGYSSAYIEDFKNFPSNKIQNDRHQKWNISSDFNKTKLPDYINKLNKDLETVAFLVIVNDSILHEQYWHGYNEQSISNSFSMSKSWISTLIGIAIKEGYISSINQKVCDFLPEFSNGNNCKITIKDLLTMSSGLSWSENYYNPIGQAAESYYGDNLRDLVMSLESVEAPGQIFRYNSACTQLLTYILEEATGETVSEYVGQKLWKPMGAKYPALWSMDRENGDEKGFCCINSNARDFGRLGRLYLNFGNWEGLQILDTSYIKEATSPANLFKHDGKKNINYGYQFWLTNYKNDFVYYARGLWGQYVICIPQKNMIIVRLGRKSGNEMDNGHFDDLYSYIKAAVEIAAN